MTDVRSRRGRARRGRARRSAQPSLPPALRYTVLGLYLVFLLFPIYWLVITSLESSADPLTGTARDFVPSNPSFDTYATLRFLESTFYDSLIVAGPAAVASTLIGAAAAYGLVHVRRSATPYLAGLLALRVLPPVGLALPLFLVADDAGLRDTHVGLILIYAVFALPFTVLVAYAMFRQLPKDIGDAALMDGCTNLQMLRHVAVPLARPGLVAALTFAFIFAWTDFAFALFLTNQDVRTIPTVVGNLTRGFGGPGSLSPLISALSIATGLIPALLAAVLVYLALRRRIAIGSN